MLINLSSKTPRSQEELKQVPLKKGLRIYFFFAYFMFTGAVLGLLSGILNMIYMKDWRLGAFQAVFGTAFFAILGLIPFYRPAKKRLELRTLAFENGELTEAIVTKQRRKFVAWKSTRDWMIDAVVLHPATGKKTTGTLQITAYQLAQKLKAGTKLQALYVKNQDIVFLPLEIGVQIDTPQK